jgi:hypothetical protein
LLKNGLVRRVQRYGLPNPTPKSDSDEGSSLSDLEVSTIPDTPTKMVLEKFRHRDDKLIFRESYPDKDLVIEKFDCRLKDQLKVHEYLRGAHKRTMEFYSASRTGRIFN